MRPKSESKIRLNQCILWGTKEKIVTAENRLRDSIWNRLKVDICEVINGRVVGNDYLSALPAAARAYAVRTPSNVTSLGAD